MQKMARGFGREVLIAGGLACALGSGCSDSTPDSTPEGLIVASWTIELYDSEISCEDALLDRVRVTAVNADTGESASSGARPCADGSAEVAVSGGTYLVSVDTIDASDGVIDHGEKLVVAASTGETLASVVVATTRPTGFLHARWSPACPSGTSSVSLRTDSQLAGEVACADGEMISDPIFLGSGTATVTLRRPDGTYFDRAERPYAITARNQIVELAPIQF